MRTEKKIEQQFETYIEGLKDNPYLSIVGVTVLILMVIGWLIQMIL